MEHGAKALVIENPDNPNEWYPQESAKALCNKLNDKYDVLNCIAQNTAVFGTQIQEAIDLTKYVVYAITVAVTNETKQCGIMNATGFTSNSIRIQFALRFAIVFAMGN